MRIRKQGYLGGTYIARYGEARLTEQSIRRGGLIRRAIDAVRTFSAGGSAGARDL